MARKTSTPATPSPDMGELFQAFQAFMASQTPAPVAETREKPKSGRTTVKKSPAPAPARKAGLKRSVNGVITCGMAWELLGADPTYAPSNPAAPARNAQLWALNSRGLLAVKQ